MFILQKNRWHPSESDPPIRFLPISSQRDCFCLATFTADAQFLLRVFALSLIARENLWISSSFNTASEKGRKLEIIRVRPKFRRQFPSISRSTAPQSTWSSTLRRARSRRVASVRRFPRKSKVVRLSRSNSVALSVSRLLWLKSITFKFSPSKRLGGSSSSAFRLKFSNFKELKFLGRDKCCSATPNGFHFHMATVTTRAIGKPPQNLPQLDLWRPVHTFSQHLHKAPWTGLWIARKIASLWGNYE